MMPVMSLYDRLHEAYGHQSWWPAEEPFEMMVGAILVQNTNWNNVEKAIARLQPDLSPERIREMSDEELEDRIRPSGFFRMKTQRLRAFLHWLERYGDDVEVLQQKDTNVLRKELLAVKGVGAETADSILLYALERPVFVIDAYTHRIMNRIGYDFPKKYEEAQAFFEQALPRSGDLFNDFHAQFVRHAKEHCKKKPVCEGCPLESDCEQQIG